MIQTLVNNDVPPTDVMQLPGHKNVQRITSYSTVSQKHHWTCLTLSLESEFRRNRSLRLALLFWRKGSTSLKNSLIQHFIQLFLSKASKQHSSPFLFFRVLLVSGEHISVAINTLNQSTTLSVPEKTLAKLKRESNLFIWIPTSVCQFKNVGSDKQQKMKSRVFISVFQILNFRRTISTNVQDILFYYN